MQRPSACLRFVLLLVVSLFAAGASADEIRHAFFVAGPTLTGIIDEEGQVTWDAQRPLSRDGFVLENGNILVAWSDEVKEFTREKTVVFHYQKSPDNQEIGTVARLDGGNTLITELGKKPRLLEVTTQGTVAVEVPLDPETDNAHLQTRMARKLDNGNYLVPHLLAFKIKEYSPTGKVVREISTDLAELGGRKARSWPFTAIRLPNGRTLAGLTLSNQVVEFDEQGAIAWRISNADFQGDPINDACGVQRLPNGNTVVASHHAKEGIKLLEVTSGKKIVWSYHGPHVVHHFQILSTNGVPLVGRPLK